MLTFPLVIKADKKLMVSTVIKLFAANRRDDLTECLFLLAIL
jgi:hypothetical protein